MPILDHTPDPDHREERLRKDAIAWLGSVRPDGRPHVVPVWFFWDGKVVMIASEPNTQKVRNLASNPKVTIALDDSRAGQDVVLFEGVATLVPEPAEQVMPPGYLEKYSGLLAEMEWSPEAYLGDYSQMILVRPTRFIVW
ncbi:MAG: hypothetical protein QOF33_2565 [Thermomicrobiales bacterium]|nr:hypothetical protein [Thermomicrobiales bacterium]